MVITELRAENVKRLSAVRIKPDGSIVRIGGENGAGKSSVLDAIEMALGGAATFDPEPVHRGKDRANVELRLSGDDAHPPLTISRTIEASGKTALVVREDTPDGLSRKLKRPQEVLNALCGRIAFDPLAFSRLDARSQATTLQSLIGLDLSAIDKKRADLYERRTEVNRSLKQAEQALAMMPFHDDAPAEPESVGELIAAIGNAEEHNKHADEQTRQIDNLRRDEQARRTAIADAKRQIDALQEKIRVLTDDADRIAAQLLNTAPTERCDTAEIRDRLLKAEETNRKVRENQSRLERAAEHQEWQDRSEDLSSQIRALDVRRKKLVESAKFPIEGLGFSESGVTYHDLPFEQASSAENVTVSAAIGLAMNPNLRVMLIREGSLLDKYSLARLGELADQAEAQIWLEVVTGDPADCSVLICDGHC